MRAEYDFSKGERKALVAPKGKTRISIFIDNAVLAEFRERAEAAGTGYQTMMNEALRRYLSESERPLTESRLREVLGQVLSERAGLFREGSAAAEPKPPARRKIVPSGMATRVTAGRRRP